MSKRDGWVKNPDVVFMIIQKMLEGHVQTEFLKFETKQHIGLLTINRQKALNAINNQLLDELHEILNHIELQSDLRCLIVTGEGDKAFVAGADIKEMSTLDAAGARAFAEKGQKVFRRFEIL